jgi:hypothetical protein
VPKIAKTTRAAIPMNNILLGNIYHLHRLCLL